MFKPSISIGFPSAATFALLMLSGAASAQDGMTASIADPSWDGISIPDGQHCSLQGGAGATPAIDVSGVPSGTAQIKLSFNDETYMPMNHGGHGVLGFEVEAGVTKVILPSVPGATEDLPEGVTIVMANKTAGDFLTAGYMPPCSGGQGNTYSVDVIALGADGAELATQRLDMGKY